MILNIVKQDSPPPLLVRNFIFIVFSLVYCASLHFCLCRFWSPFFVLEACGGAAENDPLEGLNPANLPPDSGLLSGINIFYYLIFSNILISYGPVLINYGPVRINHGPVRINYGPVRKNHEMRHFAIKNIYNEVIFDLWPPQKIYVKIGYSGYDSGKKRFFGYRPFKFLVRELLIRNREFAFYNLTSGYSLPPPHP